MFLFQSFGGWADAEGGSVLNVVLDQLLPRYYFRVIKGENLRSKRERVHGNVLQFLFVDCDW